MLTGLFKVLFLYLGEALVTLGYGKKGKLARIKLGKTSNGLALTFGILAFVWLFFGVFFYLMFPTSGDAMFCLAIAIACPVLYIIWVICARMRAPKLIEKANLIAEEVAQRTADLNAKYNAAMNSQLAAEEKVEAQPETPKAEKPVVQKAEKPLSEHLAFALRYQSDDGMIGYLKTVQNETVQEILKAPRHSIREQIQNLLENS